MDRLLIPGRLIYAIGIVGLGILCFVSKDFIAGRPPITTWAAAIPGKLAWAYISGSFLILSGLAVIFNFKGRVATLGAGLMILIFSFLSRHLYEMVDWVNAYKALALAGGSFIVAASFPINYAPARNNFLTNYTLVYTGTLFLSLFFIICGLAHFRFADFIIKDFIPSYIPFHAFWTYFCGICLLAGGVGILLPQIRKWAALLSGIMVAGWFVLLHIPRFVKDTSNASDRMGVCEAFTFIGIFFVLAALASRQEKLS